jgi:hypothetical protein
VHDPKILDVVKSLGDAARIVLGLSATIRAYRVVRRWMKRKSGREDP